MEEEAKITPVQWESSTYTDSTDTVNTIINSIVSAELSNTFDVISNRQNAFIYHDVLRLLRENSSLFDPTTSIGLLVHSFILEHDADFKIKNVPINELRFTVRLLKLKENLKEHVFIPKEKPSKSEGNPDAKPSKRRNRRKTVKGL